MWWSIWQPPHSVSTWFKETQFPFLNSLVFPKLTQSTSTNFEIYHTLVFIAIYEKFCDYILILNCQTLRNDCLYIKEKNKAS